MTARIPLISCSLGASFTGVRPSSPLRHWVWTEVNLWVVALLVLGLTFAVRRWAQPVQVT